MASITHNLSTGASVTFVLVWYWRDILSGWRAMRGNKDAIQDPHYKEMIKYREVPQWYV